jgi:hypothetical protein
MKEHENPCEEPRILSRYMAYKHLDDLLKNKRLALLNPDSWEDENDSIAINVYKERMDIKHLFVGCFTRTGETYHHWRIYGSHYGVRIVFNGAALLLAAEKQGGYRCETIKYVKLQDFKNAVNDISQVPFIKRWPYRHEKEFRIIWTGKRCSDNSKYLPLPKQGIEKIVLAPWIQDDAFDRIKKKIANKYGYDVRVERSSVLRNKRWLKMICNL